MHYRSSTFAYGQHQWKLGINKIVFMDLEKSIRSTSTHQIVNNFDLMRSI